MNQSFLFCMYVGLTPKLMLRAPDLMVTHTCGLTESNVLLATIHNVSVRSEVIHYVPDKTETQSINYTGTVAISSYIYTVL